MILQKPAGHPAGFFFWLRRDFWQRRDDVRQIAAIETTVDGTCRAATGSFMTKTS